MVHTTGETGAHLAALRALLHPLSLVAIGVLVVNDFLLKSAWPGVITGKLSDFAGLLFFPLLLAIPLGKVIRSRSATIGIAIGIAGAWFTAIKTSGIAAAATESLAETVLPQSTIVVDPTDLIATVSLLLAYILYRRASDGAHPPPSGGNTRWATRNPRVTSISVIALASLATIATSVSGPYPGFTDIALDGDRVFAGEGDGSEYPLRFSYMSNDGGMTWARLSEHAPSSVWSFAESQDLGPVCLPDNPSRCFRIDGSAIVEKSDDGGNIWQIGWSLPPGRSKFLSRYGSSWDPYDVKGWDMALVGPAGSTLLVAMGDDGVLRRTDSGTWTRDVLGSAEPLAEAGTNIYPEIVAILMLTTLALGGASLRARCIAGIQKPLGLLVTMGLLALPSMVLLLLVLIPSGLYQLLAPVPTAAVLGTIGGWFGLAAVAAVWSRLIEHDHGVGRRLLLRSLMPIIAASLTALLAFFAWSAGWVQEWAVSLALSLATATAVLMLGWRSMSAVHPIDQESAAGRTQDDGNIDTPEEGSPSQWRSHPALRRWSAAVLLTLSGPFLFLGILYLVALGPTYLAARWTGHQRPLARAMAAIGAGIVMWFVFGAVQLSSPQTALSAAGNWVVFLLVLRAPNRAAVWGRGALITGVVALSPVFGSVLATLVMAMPLLIVGIDSLTIRLRRGQGEHTPDSIARVPDGSYGGSSPQNDEE